MSKRTRLGMGLGAAGVGLALAALSGCQTWVAGMTLPSGWYLQHPPQYIAPSPVFPLSRELSRQEEVAASPTPAGPLPRNLPAPVPGAGGMGGGVGP